MIRCGSNKRFSCNCNNTGHSGRLCQNPLRSCADHVTFENVSVSGVYPIVFADNSTVKVYCNVDIFSKTAWVLVHSFYYHNNYIFLSTPFHKNLPVNEENPNFRSYRLSLSRMLEMKNHSPLWKASCNYETSSSTEVDSLRGVFEVTNLFYDTSGKQDFCSTVTYANIRGFVCGQSCKIVLRRSGNSAIHMGVGASRSTCSYPIVIHAAEQAFGLYKDPHPNCTCVKSNTTSTQWWFGAQF